VLRWLFVCRGETRWRKGNLYILGLDVEESDGGMGELLLQPCGAAKGNGTVFIRIDPIVAEGSKSILAEES